MAKLRNRAQQHCKAGKPESLYAGYGFEEAPLTSAAIRQALLKHLKAAGSYTGQTGHGTRRGKTIMEHHILGKPLAVVMKRSQIRTARIGALYVNRQAFVGP